MPRPRFVRAGLALAAAAVLMAAAARAAEPLKWAPKAGEALKYALSQSLENKTGGQGQEFSNKADLDLDMTWKVNAVSGDGTIDLALTIDRARTKITAPGAVLNYDSQDKKTAAAPANQIWAKAYDAVLGKPYAIKLSPRGEVVEVKLPEGASAALADSPLAAGADAGSFFSEAGVKNFLAQVLPKLPADPIAKGATWNSELTLPSGPVKLQFKTKYTLADPAPVATIDATLDTTVTAAPEAKITVKITKQTGTAKFLFDAPAGRLDLSTIRLSAEMSLSDGNADVTTTTEALLTLKLVK